MVEAGYFVVADKFLKGLTKKVIARPLIVRLIKSTSPAELTKILELLELIENKL